MLKKTKSIYFIKRILTLVDEKNKLDIIKYNKYMQNILDISLINYKFFSKRYIIYEKDGKGKEYDKYSDKLLFEGEYINGKRNGKGIEYDYKDGNSYLKFEGEYLNGKKWNGDGYDDEYNIVYSLKDGKGLIKEYDIKDDLIFEGEYLKGEINGKGKKYYNGDLIFEGEFLNGKRNGKGKEYNTLDDKLIFEGKYFNGKRWNGNGYDDKNNIIYSLQDGKGLIKIYDEFDNLRFEAEYLKGEINGKGKEY